MKIIFCDTNAITTTLSGHAPNAPKQHTRNVKILKGADKAIAHHHREGRLIIGISNIDAKCKSLENAIAEMRYALKLFPELLCIYICPDFKGEECWCITRQHHLEIGAISRYKGQFRKPQPGMLLHAIAAHDGDKSKCWYIGDRAEDEEAATNAGINFMAADLWRERFTTGAYII